MAIRIGLVKEVVVMALDTLRSNKMRSALTVLGVVIGITSIVGMTALVRGFDESIKDLLRTVGPTTITVTRFSFVNLTNSEVRDLLKRPNLTISDARALEAQATTAQIVDVELGAGIGPRTQQRIFYRDQKTKQLLVFGSGERFAEGALLPFIAGRYFNGTEVQFRKNVVVIGNTVYRSLFEPSGTDPIGKFVRVGSERFEVVGVLGKRASAGGFANNADDFVAIPYTTYQRIYGLRRFTVGRLGTISNIQFTVLPHDGVSQKDALDDVRRVMRIRHGLKLDQPDDFDLGTQDSLMQLYNRISQATFFVLIVISSIALMVGGIGVMAIMSITVTERTREIGVRKALGARRLRSCFNS